MFGDDSKLRLRKSHGNAASMGMTGSKLLDCEEGGGGDSLSSSKHLATSNNSASNLASLNSPAPPPPSIGRIKGKRVRRRRRQVLAKYCRLCISGLAATLVSTTLSLALLPFSWVQVDYHHQVQHEFEYVYQVLADNRRNYNTILRGIHHHEKQVQCTHGGIGFDNDQYCDCLTDGSDESKTSACSQVTVGKKVFLCRNSPNNDVWIFASRVGDGIIDCPDGSDES